MRAAAARCPERFLFKTAVGPKAAETSRTAVPVKIRPTALCELRGRHTANGGTDQPHAPTANAAGKWHQRAGLTKLRLPLTGKVTRSLSGAGPGHRHKCRDVLCGQLFELTESRSRVLPLPRALALQNVSIGTRHKPEYKRIRRASRSRHNHDALPIITTVDEPFRVSVCLLDRADAAGQGRRCGAVIAVCAN